jgi:hypothetical protein
MTTIPFDLDHDDIRALFERIAESLTDVEFMTGDLRREKIEALLEMAHALTELEDKAEDRTDEEEDPVSEWVKGQRLHGGRLRYNYVNKAWFPA